MEPMLAKCLKNIAVSHNPKFFTIENVLNLKLELSRKSYPFRDKWFDQRREWIAKPKIQIQISFKFFKIDEIIILL